MGLIIKDKLLMFIVGYPTVSDKYNITGGLLSGTHPVKFGELVCFAGDGTFESFADHGTPDAVSEVAGFVLGTNVKVAEGFATNVVQVNPGEAFNLVLPGSYLAVEVAGASSVSDIPVRGQVYVKLADGTLDVASDTGVVALPGVEFTGAAEMHGEKVIAEIYVK